MPSFNYPSPPKTTPTYILPSVPTHPLVPGGVKAYRASLLNQYHDILHNIYTRLIKKCPQDKEILEMRKQLDELARKIALIDEENGGGGIKRTRQNTKNSKHKKTKHKKRKTQKK